MGLENSEAYPEFEQLCKELTYLDDDPQTNLDPKKRLQIMDEMRHLLSQKSYKTIMREYKQERAELIRDILNKPDRNE